MDAIYFEGTEDALPKNEFYISPTHRFGGWQIGDEINNLAAQFT